MHINENKDEKLRYVYILRKHWRVKVERNKTIDKQGRIHAAPEVLLF